MNIVNKYPLLNLDKTLPNKSLCPNQLSHKQLRRSSHQQLRFLQAEKVLLCLNHHMRICKKEEDAF